MTLKTCNIVYIDDPCEFFVGVAPCFDARLYLFTLDGFGLLGADLSYGVARGQGKGSEFQVELFGCEALPGPGEYILAIAADSREPVSASGPIFDLPAFGQTFFANGVGGNDPLINWIGEVDPPPPGCDGSYQLVVEGGDLVPPGNDECFEATPISLVTDQPFSTVGVDGGSMPCGLGENDIWYVFTSPATGTVQVDLCGSLYDTVLAVYDGDECDPLPPLIECNDDGDCEGEERGGSLQSLIQFQATAGQSYLIQVGGFLGATGDGDITIKFLASPCDLPGRPDPDSSGDRVIRGYVLAWAVDQNNQEIRWESSVRRGNRRELRRWLCIGIRCDGVSRLVLRGVARPAVRHTGRTQSGWWQNLRPPMTSCCSTSRPRTVSL